MLDKIVPKLSAYAVFYWDGFIGVVTVLIGLAGFAGLLDKLPHPVGLVFFGLGLNALSMARRCVHHIGNVRRECTGYWPDIRRQAYPTFFALLFWCVLLWACCRYAALSYQINETWVRVVLHY